MEEPKPAQNTSGQVSNPPNTAQTPPPQPPAPSLPPKSKKRPLDNNVQIQNSKYFKMRLVLKGLRAHFIEVLRTPDFRNCKAAHEIREQMKVMIELYQQMTGETVSSANFKNVPASQPLSSENGFGQKPQEQSQPDRLIAKPSENRPFQSGNVSEKQQAEDGEPQGTYIVGGSAFGWNFITFTGGKPVYYGVTKESFRSAQANSVEE